MKINPLNTTFKSRKTAIREADKICRKVATEYTCVSPAKLIYEGRARKNIKTFNLGLKLQGKVEKSVRDLNIPDGTKYTSPEFFRALIATVKTNRLANCGELTRLASLACAVNGIKAIPVMIMLADKDDRLKGEIDHVMLAYTQTEGDIVFDKFAKQKDVIIIDPWLGIVDTAPNAEQKYKHDCNNIFNIKEDYCLYIDPNQNRAGIIEEEKFAELREKFPELIVK